MNEYNDILYIPGEGGGYVPPSEVEAIEIKCDVQENTGGLMIVSGETGTESVGADLVVFLKNENDITRFEVDQSLMLSRNGSEKFQVKISEVIIIDGQLKVNVI